MSTVTELEFRIFRDYDTVHTGPHPVPDPLWSFVDGAGHVHCWEDGEIPSALFVCTGSRWCDECCDEHETGEYECIQCGAVIVPGTIMGGRESFVVPGLSHISGSFYDVKIWNGDVPYAGALLDERFAGYGILITGVSVFNSGRCFHEFVAIAKEGVLP